eukprot:NODE_13523_length_474_cov_38.353276_g13230_i0.p1 GENE.NODE_13523_length_474_cov_38.353276_g13230_i0~~NODE_13523_length_474_cov_38.353276_g13230_i0.p1  ORF type:complete len:107 (-),score=6.16 NODE_13523_length_474_cov_38.353276_g13230_i0:5-325(-)
MPSKKGASYRPDQSTKAELVVLTNVGEVQARNGGDESGLAVPSLSSSTSRRFGSREPRGLPKVARTESNLAIPVDETYPSELSEVCKGVAHRGLLRRSELGSRTLR